ncbi:MAG TPA: CBS domain-containing protein [Trebonia sp.]|jgi:CBS domain-containing protein|nr:CBS domain-containing protein [Trebonia sp.]
MTALCASGTVIRPNDHLAAAAYLLKHEDETVLIVATDGEPRRPVGLITDADIVQAIADAKELNDVRILTLMTSDPTVIRATTSIQDAARIMVAGHFRHLPVVGDNDSLIGVVDILDICAALLDSSPR